MRFHLRKAGIVGQVSAEMLVLAKSVEINKRGIVLRISRIGDFQMVGIGIHSHDLALDFVSGIGKINAVAERFAHFRHTVRPGQTEAGFVFGQDRLRLRQRFAV